MESTFICRGGRNPKYASRKQKGKEDLKTISQYAHAQLTTMIPGTYSLTRYQWVFYNSILSHSRTRAAKTF
jgi:hypothetical protein